MGVEFVRGFHNLDAKGRGCVATLGNLDGLHLGHQALLAGARQKAEALGLPAVAVTFEPLPREYFAKLNQQPLQPRLTRLRDKVALFAQQQVDRLVCLHFNQALRQLSADAFVKRVLVSGLGVRYLVVGDDFRFGCDRKGDFALLQSMGATHGFDVANIHTLEIDGQRVSSSRIRELLAANQLDEAARLLGRPYSMTGRVVRGNQLGRQLGVPTANVLIGRWALPLAGVYAVMVDGVGQPRPGVANIGIRPTVDGKSKPILEVHIFNFEGDLYGQEIKVVFQAFIRSEQKFESVDALKTQIMKDVKSAQDYFINKGTM